MRKQASSSEPSKGEIVVYQPNETVRLEVRLENETVWLSQEQMIALFERDRSVISRHIRNAFAEGEVDKETCLHFLQTSRKGRPVALYNLDVIISVGYRVKSIRGTLFRRWSTRILRDYFIQGVAVSPQRDALAEEMDRRFANHEKRLSSVEERIDFIVSSVLPAPERVFCEGEFLSAHDRFIVCDNTVWFCGSSVKDAGRRMSVLVKMTTAPDFVLKALPDIPGERNQ